MGYRKTTLAVAVALVLGTAAPAEAQLWFFPDYALPSGGDTPSTWFAGSYARGLNAGEVDAIGAAIGRANESVSFAGAVGLTLGDSEELTLGGAIGVDMSQTESMTVSIQGGLGWFSADFFGETITFLRIPIGVAFKGSVETAEAMITPWAMPRVNIVRASGGGDSDTETDVGASAGVSFNFPSGFGIHTALDLVVGDGEDPWIFGIGGHYVVGS